MTPRLPPTAEDEGNEDIRDARLDLPVLPLPPRETRKTSPSPEAAAAGGAAALAAALAETGQRGTNKTTDTALRLAGSAMMVTSQTAVIPCPRQQ